MADSFTPNLNLRKPEVGAAFDTWGGTTGLNSDMDILDLVFLATGLGTSVGLNVGTGKVLNVTGTLQSVADSVMLLDDTDATKVVTFDASLLTTATTRTLQFPDENGVIATMGDVRQYLPTGTVLSGYWGGTAPAGFVMADGRTIGNALSGAVSRANADCQLLFVQLWLITNNAQCPVLPGGRGTSAVADWNANKTIALPNHSGRTMAGRDDLSGTNQGILSPSGIASTTRAAVGGAATEQAGVSVTSIGGSVSVGVNVTVGGTLGGNITAGTTTADGATGNYARGGDPVQVSGNLSGSGSGSGSITSGSGSGVTAAVTNAPPTIMVDVIIAL